MGQKNPITFPGIVFTHMQNSEGIIIHPISDSSGGFEKLPLTLVSMQLFQNY